ncbi:MAG: enoyl-CoA hydratase/isomerase family protein [Acidimicrobiia bacterium]
MSAPERFGVERPHEGVALVTMRSSDGYATFDRQFFDELLALVRGFEDDGTTRAVVVTGEGDVFSSGGDIRSYDEMADARSCHDRVSLAFAGFEAVATCALPVVAAVNGLAYGGGTELVLAADLAVAAEGARFALPEVRLGIMAAYAVVAGPPRIGPAWTKWMALTGRPVDAATAARIGLVQQVVPAADLVATAIGLAGDVARQAPLAVRATKAHVDTPRRADLSAEIATTVRLFGSQDHRIGVDAYRRKDRPQFVGR